MSRRRFAGAAIALALVFLVARPAAPRDKKDEASRTVHGSVVDKNDNAVPASVVYLVNVKTHDVTTHIADEAGTYSFSGLDSHVDYEIHAEHGDMMSATRTVSSFDTRRDIALDLKLTHPKPAH